MRPIKLDRHRTQRAAARKNGNGNAPQGPARAEVIQLLEGYFRRVRETLDLLPAVSMARAGEEMLRARAEGKTVYVLGNGGSAAAAAHAACDWRKPGLCDDCGGLRVMSLVDSVPLLTAWANDTSFENVFAAQLEPLVEAGDVVVAISASGNSPNVLNAVRVARDAGAVTVGFSGLDGGALASLVDINILVPSDSCARVEDFHLMLVHALTVVLRQTVLKLADEEIAEAAVLQNAAG